MPANPGLRGMITFQDWPSIDITFLLSAKVAKEIVDFIELGRDHLMVIVAPRVPRNLSCGSALRPVSFFTLKIIQRQNHNRLCAAQNLLRVAAFFFAAPHVTHFAGRAFSQPIAKFACMGWGSASCNTARIESKLTCKRDEIAFQFLTRYLCRLILDVRSHMYSPTARFRMSFKINPAISSGFFWEMSTRRSLALP